MAETNLVPPVARTLKVLGLQARVMRLQNPLSLKSKPLESAHTNEPSRVAFARWPAAKLPVPCAWLESPPGTMADWPLAVLVLPPPTAESLALAVLAMPPATVASLPLAVLGNPVIPPQQERAPPPPTVEPIPLATLNAPPPIV